MIDISRPNLVLVATVATWTASASQKHAVHTCIYIHLRPSIHPSGSDQTGLIVLLCSSKYCLSRTFVLHGVSLHSFLRTMASEQMVAQSSCLRTQFTVCRRVIVTQCNAGALSDDEKVHLYSLASVYPP